MGKFFTGILNAIKTHLQSRKFRIWLIALVTAGATAVLTGDPQATDMFWTTLREGGLFLMALIAGEDFVAKWNKPAEPAG